MNEGAARAAMGLRERKKFDTHRALASATVRLVAERGLDNVTVEDISGAADVSPRTFFNYFASKEEAIVLAYPDHEERSARCAERLLAAPAELSPLRALAVALEPEIDRIEADREEWLLRMSVLENNPSLVARLIALQTESERTLLDAVAQRTGLDPVADFYPGLLFAATGGAMHAAIRRWHRLDGEPDLRELLATAIDALSRGLPQPGRH
ncbi:TetR/AcrR family transcriptional regulator [Amycolatopsis nigrescens]|uniref:TetR/AcrR family transcriptional regulator n=1 Tax=Amycolatopsis nigrescens TaxID=381445 RepID=UPI001FDEB623|nr:TetR family transcriptional regulator [Amycolatopsis nigrescens]